MLDQLLPANVFGAMLIFARIGAAMMLLPGFGEFYVLQRFRLLLALLFSLLLAPMLAPSLPMLPSSAMRLAVLVGSEVVIGLFIGTVARILLSALDTAGTIISLQLGLSSAQIFNPLLAQQGALTSTFYSIMGVLLIFLTNLHHMLITALVDSYAVFAPGVLPQVGDVSQAIVQAVGGAFQLGIEISAPFIVLGLMFYAMIGVIARLVPQLQILFVTQPAQIIGGILVLAFVLASGFQWFLTTFAQQFAALTGT